MDTIERDYKVFKVIVAVFILIFLWNKISFDNTVLRNVDMKPFEEPIQEKLDDEEVVQQKFRDGHAFITLVEKYKIYGRVYDKHYMPSKLRLASIVPYDVTIGWGGLHSKEVFKTIKTTIVGRVVYWRFSSKCPFNEKEINSMMSNNHLIPANKNVKRGISRLKKKDVVYIEGYLANVAIHKPHVVERSTTSLTRNDTGLGACEMIYVTRIVSRHGDFR